MAGWAGFTEDELRKLKVSTKDNLAGVKKSSQLKRPRTTRSQFVSQMKDSPETFLDPSQRLSQSQRSDKVNSQPNKPNRHLNKADGHLKKSDETVDSGSHNMQMTADDSSKIPNREKGHSMMSDTSGAEGDVKISRELDEVEGISSEINRIEVFQKQQKMIEEANKQKRDYLAKTISERQKKAKAENEKLTKILRELNHLDNLLSSDVGIIRDKIEEASLQYQEAQRKYEKAEQEFIKAKMNLFEKGEVKEQLTEHLYTIINQNEVRKARKLAELMKQLEMEISLEEMELQIPAIPPLTNFNSVHTLNSPVRKNSESLSQQSGGAVTYGTNEKKGDIQQAANGKDGYSQQVTNEKECNIQHAASEKQGNNQQLTNEKQGTIEQTSNEKASKISGLANEKADDNTQNSSQEKVDTTLITTNGNEVNKNMSANDSDTNNKPTLLQMCNVPNSQSEPCDKNSVSGVSESKPAEEILQTENVTVDNNNTILTGVDNSCSSSGKNGVDHDSNQNCVNG